MARISQQGKTTTTKTKENSFYTTFPRNIILMTSLKCKFQVKHLLPQSGKTNENFTESHSKNQKIQTLPSSPITIFFFFSFHFLFYFILKKYSEIKKAYFIIFYSYLFFSSFFWWNCLFRTLWALFLLSF
jgi:hypothetical protein